MAIFWTGSGTLEATARVLSILMKHSPRKDSQKPKQSCLISLLNAIPSLTSLYTHLTDTLFGSITSSQALNSLRGYESSELAQQALFEPPRLSVKRKSRKNVKPCLQNLLINVLWTFILS